MTATTSLRWYVVQTHVHAESKAAAHLLRQGYETYLPRYLKRRRHARKIDLVSKPLFPRYLKASGAQAWLASPTDSARLAEGLRGGLFPEIVAAT